MVILMLTFQRLDYFLISDALKDQVEESEIHTEMHGASDHVPLTLKLSSKKA